MSYDLLIRVADKLRADAQFGYGNPDMQLIRDLAARVRELEAELTAESARWRAFVAQQKERVERAEAELRGRTQNFDDACTTLAKLEAERDALRAENERLRDALRTIANRECADEEECAGLAVRCLRQIDAALASRVHLVDF